FVSSYVSMIQMLYTRLDFPTVSSINDLYGKRFAVPKGFFLQEVLRAHPQIEIVEVPDTSAAIRAVSVGKAEALFDLMPVVDYITKQLQITNLKVGGDLGLKEGKPIPLHIAVRKEIKILARILEKGMTLITEEELQKLHEKWLTNTHQDVTLSSDIKVVLTDEERTFIAGKQIRLGVDSARPPFEYIDDKGNYLGISAEFIKAAAKRIGLTIIPQKEMKWTDAMEKIKTGEVDVIPKVTPSAAREKFMNFTKPYTTFPSVIVSRKEYLAGGLDDLRGLKVGVIKGQIIEANLKRDRPDLWLITSPDIKTALRELSTGKFDVFIDNLGAVAYTIDILGLANLRIAASTPYNHDLAFGVRKDWPLLASALDKALASLTDQEKNEIKNRWLAIKYQNGIEWRIVGPIGISLLCIITFVLIWNRRLGKAIREREHAERKINAMGQAMADALIMINSQGNVMFWNQAAEKLFGYTTEEAMGREFHDMSAPLEFREKAKAGLNNFALSGQGAVFGSTILTTAINREEQTFPVEISLSSFQVEGEWFAVGTVRDITTRKQNEEALKESERRVRVILDSINAGIILIDPENRTIVDVNPVASDMIGLTKDKIIGRRCHQFICSRAEKNCPIIDLNQRVDNAERILLTADGKEIPILKTVTPVKLSGKKHLLESFVDISERKHIEETLRESQQRLSLLVQNSPLGVIEYDLNFRIIAWNPAAERIFGYKQDDAIGRQVTDIIPDEMRSQVEQNWKTLIEQKNEVRSTNDNITRDGKRIICEWYNIPLIDESGIVFEVASLVDDITERKQAEIELKQYIADLEKFNRLTISREEKMIELKKEINNALKMLGKDSKYRIVD
ncbi:MAG: PAS domain S-box protein, partial [Desulfobacterales bacterium]|nr:PAS domain S-box protein [Desulfobacterales bacterium]